MELHKLQCYELVIKCNLVRAYFRLCGQRSFKLIHPSWLHAIGTVLPSSPHVTINATQCNNPFECSLVEC
jgi:hypothetical protein